MPSPCTVLIAAAARLADLTAHAELPEHELLSFPDVQTLKALDTIIRQRPAAVTLERSFADSPRGVALIKRIKADPSLSAADIRIIDVNAPAERAGPTSAQFTYAERPSPLTAPSPDLVLDPNGTRRVQRVNANGAPELLVDGNPATLADLSPLGAQILLPSVLKPNQRVRIALSDDQGTVRVSGIVAWASFEMPRGGSPRYRAGIEFSGGDIPALETYCLRHPA